MQNLHRMELEMQEKIDRVLKEDFPTDELRKQGVERLVSEISVYHQELIYQNAELSRTMLELETLKIRYKSLFDDAPIGYVVYDRSGRIKVVNKTFCDMTGIPHPAGTSYEFMQFVDPEDQDELYFMINRVLETGRPETIEIKLLGRDRIIEISLTSNRFMDADVACGDTEFSGGDLLIRSVIADISDLKKRQNEMMEISLRDPLTGLYNRRYYDQLITSTDNTILPLPLSIAIVDVDGLKLINDSLGHVYGDQAILAVSHALREFTEPDYRIIRVGGDEFVILFPDTTEEEAGAYLQRVEEQVNRCMVGGISLSFSWGVASKPTPGDTLISIASCAEDMMYSKKMRRSADQKSDTIGIIIQTLFERNKRIQDHSMNVASLAGDFGRHLMLSDYKTEQLKKLAYAHDIGMIAIPDSIINKKSSLTGTELRELQRHSEVGYRILRSVAGMAEIANYVLFLHENWDGTGYPYGIEGEKIPQSARIVAILDAYDRMKHGSNGAARMSDDKIREEFIQLSGKQFDPDLVAAFIESFLNA